MKSFACRFYVIRVMEHAEEIFRSTSCQHGQYAPEYVEALRQCGHRVTISAMPLASVKDDVARLFNEEMDRRRQEDDSLPVIHITGDEVDDFVGAVKESQFCNSWRITFENIAPLIPGPVGCDEPMFNPIGGFFHKDDWGILCGWVSGLRPPEPLPHHRLSRRHRAVPSGVEGCVTRGRRSGTRHGSRCDSTACR